MNDLQIAKIAAHKVINQKTFAKMSPNIAIGVLPINVAVSLTGALKKGEPYTKRVAAKANPWKLLAKALSKLNQTTIDSLVAESIAVSDDECTAIAEKANQAIAQIVATTETQMAGNITSTLNLEVL